MTGPVLQRPAAEREALAERLAARLDKPLTAAGIVFSLLVLADTVLPAQGRLQTSFEVAGWVLWAVFVGEFVLRLIIAPSTAGFLRRNWWQLIFLAVPFLRFLRPLARLRIPRLGRLLSASIRSSRAAGRRLSSRLAWLATVTLIVVLAASLLLFDLAVFPSYPDALHAAALATVTGEPFGRDAGAAKLLEIVLAVYSVVVFAALAGMLGAFFLERAADPRRDHPARDDPVPDDPRSRGPAPGGPSADEEPDPPRPATQRSARRRPSASR
ncbi:MAG: ion transporter [Euzebyales bacterium]|nr:ion transporter [Euzebyales bacterium]MBA3621413.1 ion transporter [Euzebyales bacterium]